MGCGRVLRHFGWYLYYYFNLRPARRDIWLDDYTTYGKFTSNVGGYILLDSLGI